MIYFFYGENSYFLDQEVKKMKTQFLREGDVDFSFNMLDGFSMDRNKFEAVAYAVSFFSNKKLTIIKNFLLENKDDSLKKYILKAIDSIPSDSNIVFVEYGLPDQRTVLFKKFSRLEHVKKIEQLNPRNINSWILEKVKEEDGDISNAAVQKLQEFFESDLYRLENEIKKLVLYQKASNKSKIEVLEIEKLSVSKNSPDIFSFVEALANKNNKMATLAWWQLLKSGEPELKTLSMIIYQFRTMFFVLDLTNQNYSSEKIARKAKLHPFVIGKAKKILEKYSRDKIKKTYLSLGRIDNSIKSGKIDSSLALTLLIAANG
jgi:DNA polymerase-3 subunit delta